MYNLLISLRLTTFLLASLCGWLVAFVPLARSGGRPLVQLLNQGLVSDWFASGSHVSLAVKIWFIGLCLLMAGLALNLTLCTLKRFTSGVTKRPQKLLMFLIHLVFGCQLLAHGAGFFLGWRPPPATLGNGDTIELAESEWQLEAKEIFFRDDPKILKKPRKKWTTTDFNYLENGAEVVLRQANKTILSGRVTTYQPINQGDIQITLKGFVPTPKGPAAKVIVTRSPFAKSVLWLFHALIGLFSIYLLTTWRPPSNDQQVKI